MFYARVLENPLLAPVFARMGPELPQYVARFLAEVLRGPALYTAERGGHATMLSHHPGGCRPGARPADAALGVGEVGGPYRG